MTQINVVALTNNKHIDMDNVDYNLIISGIIFMGGLLFIIGAKSNVKALVDPPEELWLFWGPSLFKKFGGPKGATIFSYTAGAIATCVGLVYLWEAFKTW